MLISDKVGTKSGLGKTVEVEGIRGVLHELQTVCFP